MVKKSGKYVPSRGDIVWLSFNPQSGHEQSGRRPGIVVSPKEYNETVGLALCCPITSRIKDYPFEVRIVIKNKIDGVILSDQLKSLDWRERQVKYIASAPKEIMQETIEKLTLLINSDNDE
ncbi:MAG: mRNA-degrading endonuclease [Chloroflexi bacterium HGW-Chloroflexi-5]|nr:MAG: mRNA-degrading endonuclease [Deltaproteobacteria bacterium HGW-Deltaproteobacteria-12]PKN96695.1 MAG: mRNA-degrading endonuclease [Chloroflexi bacterium HGW-Chloroflexi-5]